MSDRDAIVKWLRAYPGRLVSAPTGQADAWLDAHPALEENQRLRGRVGAFERLLEAIYGYRCESQGIAGFHANGDVLLWDEIEEMAEIERQLPPKGAAQVVYECQVEYFGERQPHLERRGTDRAWIQAYANGLDAGDRECCLSVEIVEIKDPQSIMDQITEGLDPSVRVPMPANENINADLHCDRVSYEHESKEEEGDE